MTAGLKRARVQGMVEAVAGKLRRLQEIQDGAVSGESDGGVEADVTHPDVYDTHAGGDAEQGHQWDGGAGGQADSQEYK